MAKVKPNYWLEKRSAQALVESEYLGKQAYKQLLPLYQGALRNINGEINRLYTKVASKFNIDVSELSTIINGDDKARFTKALKANLARLGLNIDDVYDKGYLAQLSRLEALKAQIYWELMAIAPQERDILGRTYAEVVQQSYGKTAENIGKASGIATSMAQLDTNVVNNILNERWKGGNYSSRVWANTENLAHELPQVLGTALISGTSYQRTVNDVSQMFQLARYRVNDVAKKGMYEARRLVLTETAYFHEVAELKSYKDLGVKEYEFSAILDKRTSKVCEDHNNNRYLVEEAVVGDNYPPLHPHCRSTTYAILDDDAPNTIFGTPNPTPRVQAPILPTPPVTITTDTGKKVTIQQQPIIQTAPKPRVEVTYDEALLKEAKKYGTVEDFIKAQGTPLYHGTNRNFTSFDINRAFTSRNEQLGAGKAVYLTTDKAVAEKYANANGNASFDTVVIEEVKAKNKLAGELLQNLHTYGYEQGWQKFTATVPNGIQQISASGIEVNDIGDIYQYIRGAKIDAPTNGADMGGNLFASSTSSQLPSEILEMAKRLGVKSVPSEARVVEVFTSKDIKLKKLGYIDDIQETAIQVQRSGYDGMKFTSAYTVDEVPEIAVFNTAKIKTKDELIQIYNNAKAGAETATSPILGAQKTEESLKVYQFTDNYKKLTGNSIKLTDYEKRVIDEHFIKVADTPQTMVSRTGTRRAQFDSSKNTIEFSKYGIEQTKDLQEQVLLHEFGHAIDRNANPKTMTRWVNVGGQSKEVAKPIPYSDSRKLFATEEIAVIVKSRMPLDKWGFKVENDTSFLRYGEVRKENGALTYLKMKYINYAKKRTEVFAEAYALYRTQREAYKDKLPKLFAFFDEITV